MDEPIDAPPGETKRIARELSEFDTMRALVERVRSQLEEDLEYGWYIIRIGHYTQGDAVDVIVKV